MNHATGPFRRIAAIAAVLSLASLARPARADILAISTFDGGTEGWTLGGDSTSIVPQFLSTGGNPGGFLRGTDEVDGRTWFWDAPAKFLGNISASYGGTLTFDLRQRGDGNLFDDIDLIIRGNNGPRLVFDTSVIPRDRVWTSYRIGLTETSGWRLDSLDGRLATRSEFLAILSDASRLRIRGEFIDGDDTGDLDNVALHTSAVPEPGSMALLGLGVAGLGGWRVRRKAR